MLAKQAFHLPALSGEVGEFYHNMNHLSRAIATGCLQNQNGVNITENQWQWFLNFAEWWVRWFYNNDSHWKANMSDVGKPPKTFLKGKIDPLTATFLKNPEDFIAKRREDAVESPDPEWKSGGKLV